MRLLLIIVGAFAAFVCIERPAEAQNYPWCAYYNFFRGGATNCGFSTFSTMLSDRERGWRELWAQSNVSARAEAVSG
jgi:hypothetical protein